MGRVARPATRRRAREQDTADRLRAKVYVLEGTLSTLIDDIEAWRDGRAQNDPVPRDGQLVCAEVARELVTELTERLKHAKTAAKRAKVKLWDPMKQLPKERR
jgi:hypothetical protein